MIQTTVGGLYEWIFAYSTPTNILLSLSATSSKKTWKELFPPMPTKRRLPAVITMLTHLLVAGGSGASNELAVVELLNIETHQWSTARNIPQAVGYPLITALDKSIYLSNNQNSVFSCSIEKLLESCKPTSSSSSSDGGSVWTKLADIPVKCGASLATLRGHVLAIGGAENVYGDYITGAIHRYEEDTNLWSAAGEMPTPRYRVLTAVLESNDLIVVGGCKCRYNTPSVVTEIGNSAC